MSRHGPVLFGLAGALVASLGANLYLSLTPPSAAPPVESPLAAAQRGPCGMADGGCRSSAPCDMVPSAGVTLADGQRDRLTRCCADASVAQASLLQAIAACRTELRAKLHEYPLDRPRVEGLAKELGRLRGELLCKRVDSILVVQETLTPEQITTLSTTR